MRFVLALAVLLALTAAAHGEPGLPAEIEGATSDWTSLADAAMAPDIAANWKRDNGELTGTTAGDVWRVCELGTVTFGDCAVRARVKTAGSCGIRVQVGGDVVATLTSAGVSLVRGAEIVAVDRNVTPPDPPGETELVLVRRASRLELWIDGERVLAGRDVPRSAKPGVGVRRGAATFTDVRVRRFPVPAPLPGEDGKPIPSTNLPESLPVKVAGVFVHAGTGLPFPEEAGGARRVAIKRYDAEANDVEVDYAKVVKGGAIVVSVYAYPAITGARGKPVPFLEQFQGEVKEVHGHANVVDGAVTETKSFCGGRAVEVRTQEFEMDMDPPLQKIRSATWLTAFRMGPWHVTYRITAPKEARGAALTYTESLLAALGMPPLGIAAEPK